MDTALDFNDAVAAELRRQRAARGLTIDEVARRAGMVRTTVLRYLNGKRPIPIGALYRLSAALCLEAHRVVAAAEASCAVGSTSDAVSAVDALDSPEPSSRLGPLFRVPSSGARNLLDRLGTESKRAHRPPLDDDLKCVDPQRGVPLSV